MEFNEFESFVRDIPMDGVVLVRVNAEQVLEPEECSVDMITIENGIVVSQEPMQRGVFGKIEDLRGFNRMQLSGWSAYENLMPGSAIEDVSHEVLVL